MAEAVPDWLHPLLLCPGCGGMQLVSSPGNRDIHCRRCDTRLAVDAGVVRIERDDEDETVSRERQAVLEIERTSTEAEAFTFEELMADTAELREALLSLPYGNGSRYFEREGYFTNVAKFAPEFDYVVGQLRLPADAVVLDVGADLTWSTARLAARGWRAVATDINHHLPAAAHFRRTGLAYATVNVDMHAPVFGDAVFDAITAFNALHHTHRLDVLAANLARSLKSGGQLGFVEPFCRNEQERQQFGRAQIEAGINENVHLLEEWHDAFRRVGLRRRTCLLTTAFAGIYEKPTEGAPPPLPTVGAAADELLRAVLRRIASGARVDPAGSAELRPVSPRRDRKQVRGGMGECREPAGVPQLPPAPGPQHRGGVGRVRQSARRPSRVRDARCTDQSRSSRGGAKRARRLPDRDRPRPGVAYLVFRSGHTISDGPAWRALSG